MAAVTMWQRHFVDFDNDFLHGIGRKCGPWLQALTVGDWAPQDAAELCTMGILPHKLPEAQGTVFSSKPIQWPIACSPQPASGFITRYAHEKAATSLVQILETLQIV